MKDLDLKINKVLTQDLVYDELKKLILNGTWKAGDRLPSEKELAETFDVNRLTIRMAIQKLNTMGITETQIGKGTYVIDFDMHRYLNQISSFIGNIRIDDVLEFRNLVELNSAELAVEKATKSDIKKLRDITNNYRIVGEQLVKAYPENIDEAFFDEYVHLDYSFHEEIVKLSSNKIYLYAYALIKEPIINYLKYIIKMRMSQPEFKDYFSNDLHALICDAIEDRDYEKLVRNYKDLIDYKVYMKEFNVYQEKIKGK